MSPFLPETAGRGPPRGLCSSSLLSGSLHSVLLSGSICNHFSFQKQTAAEIHNKLTFTAISVRDLPSTTQEKFHRLQSKHLALVLNCLCQRGRLDTAVLFHNSAHCFSFEVQLITFPCCGNSTEKHDFFTLLFLSLIIALSCFFLPSVCLFCQEQVQPKS